MPERITIRREPCSFASSQYGRSHCWVVTYGPNNDLDRMHRPTWQAAVEYAECYATQRAERLRDVEYAEYFAILRAKRVRA